MALLAHDMIHMQHSSSGALHPSCCVCIISRTKKTVTILMYDEMYNVKKLWYVIIICHGIHLFATFILINSIIGRTFCSCWEDGEASFISHIP